jgi:hypothetical protein
MAAPGMVTALDDATLDRLRVQLTPSAFYMRVDDNIRVTSYNAAAGVSLALRSRFLGLDGEIMPSADLQTPNTDRSAKSTIVPTPEGWLLGAQIFAVAGTPLIGQCFVVVEIVQGLGSSAIVLQTLAAGYVTAKQPLSWPGAPIASSLDGAGALRAIVGTVPGAGAEISETVPTAARWELLTFAAQLTTAVAVANRVPVLVIDDGTNNEFLWPAQGNETASLAWQNHWAQGSPSAFTLGALTSNGPLPTNNRLGAGFRIRTSTVALQGADQWSSPKYLVREWQEGA